jgi:uncharacterized protein (DUF1800 family)
MKLLTRFGSGLFCLIFSVLFWFCSASSVEALPFPSLLALSQPIDPLALHIVNRLSFGPKPGDLDHIQAIGVEDYIQEQLNSDNRLNPIDLEQKLNRLPDFNLTPIALLQNYLPKSPPKARSPKEERQFQKQLRSVLQETITAHLWRVTESSQQLQEVMTAFWFNHFNIYGRKGRNNFFTASYESQALRPNVFGNFRELLGATAKHPAMLLYLDNYRNRVPNPRNPKVGINENYARELLELHTLGVDGGYTQADVIALARILTGWTILPDKKISNAYLTGNGFYFDSKIHDFSDKIFMGHEIKGTGEAEGEQVLDILAKHPATAKHLSYKLAQYFVSDRPPQSLVNRLSQSYLKSDGNIKAVLDNLFHSPEFRDPQYFGKKFKTPYQYVISAIRAGDLEVTDSVRVNDLLKQMSMGIYDCLTPNGYANTEEVWLNPDALLRRLTFASTVTSKKVAFLESSDLKISPLKTENLYQTLGEIFSQNTQQAIADSPPDQRPMLILGSPEFMYH